MSLGACGGHPLNGSDAAPNAGAGGGIGGHGPAMNGGAGVDAGADRNATTPSAMLPSGICITNAFRHDGGACTCQPDTPAVCPTTCANLELDDDNCGACGNKCPDTATCNDGKCGQEPTVLRPASLSTSPLVCGGIDLALAGSILYAADAANGSVFMMPATGGPPVVLVKGELRPKGIVVRGQTMFWMAGEPIKDPQQPTPAALSIHAAPVGGGPVHTIFLTADGVGGFTVSPDGQSVFVSSGAKLWKVPAAGGAGVVVGVEAHNGIPRALALDGTNLVFPNDINGDIDVIQLVDGTPASCGNVDPVTGGLLDTLCARVSRGQGSLLFDTILARDGWVSWADGNNLTRNPLTPGSLQFNENVVSLDNSIAAMTFGASAIYFAIYDPGFETGGEIGKTPLASNTTAVLLARHQNGPRSIAADDARVYWSTKDCAIFSLPN
ncbi:MAG: hypothetical protein JWM82_2947 [Myxococcales bacterium]|nr:hypothetical protein [Myxococcales bacterium]